MSMKSLLPAMLVLASVGCTYAQGTHLPDYKGPRITLDARASQEVENDVMRAMLFVEAEDTDPARLADKVNRTTAEALELAKGYPGMRTRTSGYSTYPVTEKGRIVRWRARSELSVEGEDFQRMAQAIGKLQAQLQLGGVDFSVSPASRAKAEESLTQAAIEEFLRKADRITRSFNGDRFDVLEASVSADGGYNPPPRPMLMMKSMSDSGPAAPALEGGTTRITVTVNGAVLIPR
jgi:predicted secreted protein